MTFSPILGFAELAESQAVPEVTVNEAHRYLEQGAGWFVFLDRDLTAPPGSPADGDAYLVAASATGAWSGHDGEIAYRFGTSWNFIIPREGMAAYIADENAAVAFDGSTWGTIGGTPYTDAQARAAVALAPTTQSGTSYTAVLGDANGHIRFSNGSAVAYTIPPNSSVAFPTGTVLSFTQAGAGTVTLTPGSGVSLNSRGGVLASAGQFAVVHLKKVATNEWDVIGDVA